MSARRKIRGFYAILDRNDEQLGRRLLSSARVLQVRIKGGTSPAIAQTARMARRLAKSSGALIIVNDQLDIALRVRSDGVHLGQEDLSLPEARAKAPSGFLIGVSTHNLDQVKKAVDEGADYIGYGPVFATSSKENPDPVQGVDALREAVEAAGEIPVVAIGGITLERVAAVAAAGAAAACAIRAVNEARDPSAAGRAIVEAFKSEPPE